MTFVALLSILFAMGCWFSIVFTDVPSSRVVRPWLAFIGLMVGILGAGIL